MALNIVFEELFELNRILSDSATTTRMTTFAPRSPAMKTSLYDIEDEEVEYDYSQAVSEATVTSTGKVEITLFSVTDF